MVLRGFRYDPTTVLRRRMIRETELALLIGLRFPKRMPRIPTMEVGKGTFDPGFAERFWEQALELDRRRLAALTTA